MVLGSASVDFREYDLVRHAKPVDHGIERVRVLHCASKCSETQAWSRETYAQEVAAAGRDVRSWRKCVRGSPCCPSLFFFLFQRRSSKGLVLCLT